MGPKCFWVQESPPKMTLIDNLCFLHLQSPFFWSRTPPRQTKEDQREHCRWQDESGICIAFSPCRVHHVAEPAFFLYQKMCWFCSVVNATSQKHNTRTTFGGPWGVLGWFWGVAGRVLGVGWWIGVLDRNRCLRIPIGGGPGNAKMRQDSANIAPVLCMF